MLSLNRELREIEDWHRVVEERCTNVPLLETVAEPWFHVIGPTRAVQYGVLGLNELGTQGVLAQVFNCYYRWAYMESQNDPVTEMLDVMRDAMGFAVLAGIVGGVNPEMVTWWAWHNEMPSTWYHCLKQSWESRADDQVPAWSWALAVGMFNKTWRRG